MPVQHGGPFWFAGPTASAPAQDALLTGQCRVGGARRSLLWWVVYPHAHYSRAALLKNNNLAPGACTLCGRGHPHDVPSLTSDVSSPAVACMWMPQRHVRRRASIRAAITLRRALHPTARKWMMGSMTCPTWRWNCTVAQAVGACPCGWARIRYPVARPSLWSRGCMGLLRRDALLRPRPRGAVH